MSSPEWLTVVNADRGLANVISVTLNSQDEIYIGAK